MSIRKKISVNPLIKHGLSLPRFPENTKFIEGRY